LIAHRDKQKGATLGDALKSDLVEIWLETALENRFGVPLTIDLLAIIGMYADGGILAVFLFVKFATDGLEAHHYQNLSLAGVFHVNFRRGTQF